jgi:DNA (cytosine-5)-methyltransferase 1
MELFSGIGGGILASRLLGHRIVCAVELDPYCRCVLMQRQNDGHLPPFPIWDDIRTFDGRVWRGVVDVVSGGFPCQNISPAGDRTGITGEKSSLWFEMLRVVREVRPRYVFVENSAQLVRRGLDTILGGLDEYGYDAEWCVLGASDVGAPHYRKRCWILAYANGRPAFPVGGGMGETEKGSARHRQKNDSAGLARRASADERGCTMLGLEQQSCESSQRNNEADVPNANNERLGRRKQFQTCSEEARDVENTDSKSRQAGRDNETTCLKTLSEDRKKRQANQTFRPNWWETEPGMGGTFDEFSHWLDGNHHWIGDWEQGIPRTIEGCENRVLRLKGLGNAQVPLCAATAWRILYERINGSE